LDWKTGESAWEVRTAIKGHIALTYADGHLYLRGSDGLMILTEAAPKEYRERGSFRIPEPTAAMGATFPVIAGSRLYVRDTDKLLAYDISADAFTKPRIKPRTVAISLAASVSLPQGSTPPRIGRERAPDAVYVPTPEDIVEKMLNLAAIEKKDVI